MKHPIFLCVSLLIFQFVSAQTDTIQPKKNLFTIVEKMPSWKGCELIENESQKSSCTYEKIMDYLTGEMKYPESAKEQGVQGKVYVNFVIDETGKVTNPAILRGVSPELDAEAIRVVSMMPSWNPGMNKGLPVPVQYLLPIYFTLKERK